jgi:hypothetical protein
MRGATFLFVDNVHHGTQFVLQDTKEQQTLVLCDESGCLHLPLTVKSPCKSRALTGEWGAGRGWGGGLSQIVSTFDDLFPTKLRWH